MSSSRRGRRAVVVSLAALGATALGQALLVGVTGSVALLNDTIHNAADALTGVPLWIAFTLGTRPPDRRFTYGFGRAEDVAGVVVVAVIAAGAVLAGVEAVQRLLDPRSLAHPLVAALAGIVGFAGNEAVAVYRVRVGREIGSAALVADGLHARVDGLTSLGVVAAAVGSALGWEAADGIAGLAISIAILGILRSAGAEVLPRLMDAVDPALVERVERTAAGVPGVRSVEAVRLRWVGHRLRADVAISVDPALSVGRAHDIAEEVHHALLHELDKLHSAFVHVHPADQAGPHRAIAHHLERD